MITSYSFAMAVIFFNIAIVLVYLMRRNTVFLAKYSVNTLIIITVLGIIRLVVPIDVASQFIIRSDEWLPFVENEILGRQILGVTVGRMIILVWIIGGVYTLVCKVKEIFTETKALYDLEDVGADEYLPIVNELVPPNVKIVVSPLIDTPQSIGLLKPRIYLPDSDFSEAELRYILRHEMQHIKGHDAYIKILFTIIRSVFWWNLIMRGFVAEMDRVLELRCDDKVINSMSMEEKMAYLETLYVMKEAVNPDTPYFDSLYGFIKPKEDLGQRLILIAEHHKKSRKHFAVIVSIAAAIFVASYCIIVQPIILPDVEENEGMIDITAENSYLVQISEDMYCVKFNNITHNEEPLIIPASMIEIEPFSQLEIRKK